jgi:hypothetical protein
MHETSPEESWRCASCAALLGVRRGDRIELRYKTALYVVRGEVTARCRRCGTTNRLSSLDGARALARSPPATSRSVP